jgi:hypothetical protein
LDDAGAEVDVPDPVVAAAQLTVGFHMLNIPDGLFCQIQACSE